MITKQLSPSQKAMRSATTVDESTPEITIIAREEGLDLTKGKDWRECIRIFDLNKLNKR